VTNLNKALIIARAMVQSNKKDRTGRQLLGNVLYALSETYVNPSNSIAEISEAIEIHKKLLADFGENSEVVNALADDYNILSDDDWYYLKEYVDAMYATQTAVAYTRRSAQLAPHDPEMLRRLILRMEKLGRLETYVDPYLALQNLQSGMALWNAQSDKVKATNAAQRIRELLEDDLGDNFALVGNRYRSQQAMQIALDVAQRQLTLNPRIAALNMIFTLPMMYLLRSLKTIRTLGFR
jgi:tetratricopeptide (TPR) repeat protein